MSQLFTAPYMTILDGNGTPINGAKAYFYLTGTTTPEDVFTSEALTTPHANPVIADSAGRLPAIFLSPDKIYRCDIKSASDTLIKSIDPINYDIAGQLAASSGSSLVGFLQQGTGAVARTVEGKLQDALCVKDFGAVADGLTNDSAAFAAARTAAAGRRIYAPAGTYKLSTALTSSEDIILEGDGPSTILDFSGTVTGGNYGIEAIGTATQIEELSGTQNVGSTSVTFVSAPSLSIGDVFVIFNPTASSWSGFRAEYCAGEWCEVESISGSTVTLKNPLYDTYAAAAVDVYKITGPKVVLRNFAIKGTTLLGLIKATYCTNVVIENVTATHANDSILYLDRCFNASVLNPNFNNVGDGGDDYAIAIGNSQHIRVIGGYAYARRHAVTHGGTSGICTVPVRDSRQIGMVMKNDPSTGVTTFDYHGNVEDCSATDCTIYGAAGLAGKNVTLVNCSITADSGGRCVYHSEVKGGRLGARGCTFTTYIDPDSSSRAIYDIGGNNNAVTSSTNLDTTFFVHDCNVFGRNLSATTIFGKFTNSGSTSAMNIDINGVTANVNLLGEMLRTTLVSGTADSDFIIVDNVSGFPIGTKLHTAVGSAYLNFPHRLQKQTGSESITATSGTASTSGTLVSFKYPYPRIPNAIGGGANSFNGNVVAVPGINSVSETQIRPWLYSANNVNWTATTAYTVNWSAEIAEV